MAARLDSLGVELQRGDVRDADARKRALDGVDAVVHLAAIVGDPACGRDPELSNAVNVEGTAALVADARAAGVERFLFASTCSNYGRMADPTVPIDETGELRPVSLYAEQKVAIEQRAARAAARTACPPPACASRPSTASGHRMRFDLTVNEFTRDLWADRKLDVFGETFWRPYVHVRDAARAVALVLASPREKVAGRVFNAGHSDENYRKLDLVELITGRLGRGDVDYVSRTRTRATTRSRSSASRTSSASSRCSACRPASTSSSARSRRSASATRSTPATPTSADERRAADPAVRRPARAGPPRRRRGHAALGLADDGPAHPGVRAGLRRAPRRRSTRSRSPTAPRRCTSPTWRPASVPATR